MPKINLKSDQGLTTIIETFKNNSDKMKNLMFALLHPFWFETKSKLSTNSKLFLSELESRDVPSSVIPDENQSPVFASVVETIGTVAPISDHADEDIVAGDAFECAFAETNLAAKGDILPETNGKWKDKDGKEILRKDVIENGGNGWWHSNVAGTKPIEYKDGRPDFTPYTVKDKGKPIEVEIPYDKDKNGNALQGKDADRNKHFETAEEEWKKKNPNWVKPPNTTWHHQSYDPSTGKGTMILVPTPIHKPIPHTGSFSDYKKEMESKKQPSPAMALSDNLSCTSSTYSIVCDVNHVSTTLLSLESDVNSSPNSVLFPISEFDTFEEYDCCPLIMVS